MQDFSLDKYRVFLICAQKSSFTAAAKELFMSQSAVSQSIWQLEDNLSVQLFLRIPKGIKLTKAGQELYEYVRNALTILDAGKRRMHDIENIKYGTVHIGTGDALCRHILLGSLVKFSNMHPDIKIEVTNSTSRDSINLMELGKVDFALAHTYNNYLTGYKYEHISKLHLIAVASEEYILDKVMFSLNDFTKHPLILLDKTTSTRASIDKMFLSNDIEIDAEFTTGSTDCTLDIAKNNLGVAIVTKEFIDDYKGLKQIPCDFVFPTRMASLITKEGVKLSPSAQKLYDILIEMHIT